MPEQIVIRVPYELPERDEKLTLKQASDLADLCLEDFMKVLSEKKVSLINRDEEELQKELENANSF